MLCHDSQSPVTPGLEVNIVRKAQVWISAQRLQNRINLIPMDKT
jgi:hypothetical protein